MLFDGSVGASSVQPRDQDERGGYRDDAGDGYRVHPAIVQDRRYRFVPGLLPGRYLRWSFRAGIADLLDARCPLSGERYSKVYGVRYCGSRIWVRGAKSRTAARNLSSRT